MKRINKLIRNKNGLTVTTDKVLMIFAGVIIASIILVFFVSSIGNDGYGAEALMQNKMEELAPTSQTTTTTISDV